MTDTDILQRILIFDDDADLRKLLITYLDKLLAGVELVQYDPLVQGVPPQDFDWSRYDVLILDYYLGIQGVTGLDILHQNRKNPAFPATIMLTGAGNEEVAMRALKAGVYDYLRKQSLDKQELKNSILLAFEKYKQTKKRLSDLTQQGSAFNKSLFYQQLECRQGTPEFRPRVLLLMELDNHASIEDSAGMILRDNIVRHIAKQAYEVFKLGECNPVVTRMGDYSIAMLIDAPTSTNTLEFNIKGLLTHLDKRPYRFGDENYPFTISIGLVRLTGQGETADTVIGHARAACRSATRPGVSSYHIYTSESVNTAADKLPAHDDNRVTPASADTPQPAVVPPASSPVLSTPVSAEPVRPQKSLAELKTETFLPGQPAETRPVVSVTAIPASPAREEGELDMAALNDAARNLKIAFDEKRVIQLFQPVISLLNEEIESEDECYRISLQLVDKDGKLKTAADIKAMITLPAFRKYVDRWLLREIIGRLTNSNKNRNTFIIELSNASMADAGFFNWLRKLLTGLDAKTPGKFIAMEIDAKHLTNLEKQANALITYLRKTHDFRFVLGNLDSADEIVRITGKIRFDLIRCNYTLIGELASMPPAIAVKTASSSQLEVIKSTGCRFIADNINDATTLTETIALGAEYAIGDFIGEPAAQLDDVTNIETFEIT